MSSVAALPTISVRRPVSSLRAHLESSLGERLASTLLLRERAAPLTVPIGIAPLDALTGGLPRGALSEITGPPSSGRTGVMLSALANATQRQEVCALVDASDSFDPASAATAGVNLERLLWVRCTQPATARRISVGVKSRPPGFAFSAALEQVLKVTDLLLQSGGFGMVVLDLGDVPLKSARRVPLTSWFRFRRAVEPTATVLLLIEQEPCAKTCASLVLRLQAKTISISNSDTFFDSDPLELKLPSHNVGGGNSSANSLKHCAVSHARLLRGMGFHVEVMRCPALRKPPQSIGTHFELRTAL